MFTRCDKILLWFIVTCQLFEVSPYAIHCTCKRTYQVLPPSGHQLRLIHNAAACYKCKNGTADLRAAYLLQMKNAKRMFVTLFMFKIRASIVRIKSAQHVR